MGGNRGPSDVTPRWEKGEEGGREMGDGVEGDKEGQGLFRGDRGWEVGTEEWVREGTCGWTKEGTNGWKKKGGEMERSGVAQGGRRMGALGQVPTHPPLPADPGATLLTSMRLLS